MTNKPRIMTIDELRDTVGHGWEENWIEPEFEGGADRFELTPCAWCLGSIALPENCHATVGQIESLYNKRYGLRMWSDFPAPEDTEAAPWDN